jgi:hypothetical protein
VQVLESKGSDPFDFSGELPAPASSMKVEPAMRAPTNEVTT